MLYLTNAFSLNMLDPAQVEHTIRTARLSLEQAQEIMRANDVVNAIGHADTDAVVRGLLDCPTLAVGSRLSLSAVADLLVAQYSGPRLPEGATALPEGATIIWLRVTVG
jgi:hypothetical protein